MFQSVEIRLMETLKHSFIPCMMMRVLIEEEKDGDDLRRKGRRREREGEGYHQ